MKTIKYIILTAFIIQILYSCYEPEPKETIYISEEDKPYIMYPEGSWWVYRDSVSGALDSFYLEEQILEMEYDASLGPWEFESLYQYFRFSVDNDELLINHTDRICCGMRFSPPNYNYSNYYIAFFFFSAVGDSIRTAYNLKTLDILPTLQIAENTYSDVRYLKQSFPDDNYRHTLNESFWTKEIGMIKARLYQYTFDTATVTYNYDTLIVKELIRYHINN